MKTDFRRFFHDDKNFTNNFFYYFTIRNEPKIYWCNYVTVALAKKKPFLKNKNKSRIPHYWLSMITNWLLNNDFKFGIHLFLRCQDKLPMKNDVRVDYIFIE